MRSSLRAATRVAFLGASSGGSAQEARLRPVRFLPGNASFSVSAKRWVEEVPQIDFVGLEAVSVPEQPKAVKTGVVLHNEKLSASPLTGFGGGVIHPHLHDQVALVDR